MPVDRLEPLTNVNKIAEIQISSRLTIQPGTHYTCPVGKKAIFNGTVTCTLLGAATIGNLRDPTDSFNLASWKTAFIANQWWLVNNLQTGTIFNVSNMELSAGETIKTTQNSGNNAEFNVVGTVLELAS